MQQVPYLLFWPHLSNVLCGGGDYLKSSLSHCVDLFVLISWRFIYSSLLPVQHQHLIKFSQLCKGLPVLIKSH